MPRIFINYRRDDNPALVNHIYEKLRESFGTDSIFKDVDNMIPGYDFRQVIRDAVQSVDVMLVMIGSNWLSLRSSKLGKRRIHEPDDFVRMEIELGLQLVHITVIPVLLENTPMPPKHLLPKSIESLSFRHALEVRLPPDFTRDIERLIRSLQEHDNALLSPRTYSNSNPLLLSSAAAPIPPSELIRDDFDFGAEDDFDDDPFSLDAGFDDFDDEDYLDSSIAANTEAFSSRFVMIAMAMGITLLLSVCALVFVLSSNGAENPTENDPTRSHASQRLALLDQLEFHVTSMRDVTLDLRARASDYEAGRGTLADLCTKSTPLLPEPITLSDDEVSDFPTVAQITLSPTGDYRFARAGLDASISLWNADCQSGSDILDVDRLNEYTLTVLDMLIEVEATITELRITDLQTLTPVVTE